MGYSPDPLATFYGGYERTHLVRPPWLRIRPIQIAIGVAVLALISVIVADTTLLAAGPPKVTVTAVEWEVGGAVLTATAGFQAHPSQSIVLTLSCSSLCYRFTGATVNSPFQVVSFVSIDSPIQFTNVTVRAPSSAYSGELIVSLSLPAPSG